MIEENSPLGWLIFFGLMAFIAFFSFNIRRNVFKDPPGDKRQDYTKQWRSTHQSVCPECGSNDIKYDFGRMIDYSTTGICRTCGYTWVWQGSRFP